MFPNVISKKSVILKIETIYKNYILIKNSKKIVGKLDEKLHLLNKPTLKRN